MKVLIISHNPISTQSNMGRTFLSLFSDFETEELCQIYIYPVIPNVKRSSSYFRMTDKEALKSVLLRKVVGGEIPTEIISEEQGLYENADDQQFYKNKKNKSALRRLLRDVMWKLAPWYSCVLEEWLRREAPEIIFVAPGVAKFIYDFALTISRKLQIPIVTYICDEYYFVKEPETVLDRLRLKLLRRKMETLMQHTAQLIVISEELKAEYSKRFGVETSTIMTGSSVPAEEFTRDKPLDGTLCYFGNVRCNRYVSLREIGQQLDVINQMQGKNYRLKIYTAEKEPQIIRILESADCIEMCGFVSGDAFVNAMKEADVLVHTEAFDADSIDFTKHSVSTKIADSLASGIPMLAYGPEGIASMRHLIRHKCAVTAVSGKELHEALLCVLQDEKNRQQVAVRGLAVAREYHESMVSSEKVRALLERTINMAEGCA